MKQSLADGHVDLWCQHTLFESDASTHFRPGRCAVYACGTICTFNIHHTIQRMIGLPGGVDTLVVLTGASGAYHMNGIGCSAKCSVLTAHRYRNSVRRSAYPRSACDSISAASLSEFMIIYTIQSTDAGGRVRATVVQLRGSEGTADRISIYLLSGRGRQRLVRTKRVVCSSGHSSEHRNIVRLERAHHHGSLQNPYS